MLPGCREPREEVEPGLVARRAGGIAPGGPIYGELDGSVICGPALGVDQAGQFLGPLGEGVRLDGGGVLGFGGLRRGVGQPDSTSRERLRS